MADFTTNEIDHGNNVFARVLDTIWRSMVWLGQSTARAQKLQAISEMSDAEFEAMGITRVDAVKALFSDGYSC